MSPESISLQKATQMFLLAFVLIVPVSYALQLLPENIYIFVGLGWAVASFFILRAVVSWQSGIQLGFGKLLWYLVAIPILVAIPFILVSLPLAIWLDADKQPFWLQVGAGAVAVVLFWCLVSVAAGKSFVLQVENEKKRLWAQGIVAGIPRGGKTTAEEDIAPAQRRYVFGDGRTEYTLRENGKEVLHREDGPALVLHDGSEFYFLHGKLDGDPAVRLADGSTMKYHKGSLMSIKKTT